MLDIRDIDKKFWETVEREKRIAKQNSEKRTNTRSGAFGTYTVSQEIT
jgi:hypothetical protein